MKALDRDLENIYFYVHVSNVYDKEYALLKENRCIFLFILM